MEAGRLVVAAAIVDDLDRPNHLLAARRSSPKSLAGRWEFPGGKVEDGESHHDALHREIAEELGVRITIGREVPGPADGWWPVTSHHLMRVWLAEVAGGRPEPRADHDEIRWLGPGDWHAVPWLEADLPIVAAARGMA